MTHTQLTQLVQALLDAPTSNGNSKGIQLNLGLMQKVHLNKKNLQNNSYP